MHASKDLSVGCRVEDGREFRLKDLILAILAGGRRSW